MPVLWTTWSNHRPSWRTKFLLNRVSPGNVAVVRCLYFSRWEMHLCPGYFFCFLPKCCCYHSRGFKVVLLSVCSGSSFTGWNLIFQALHVHEQAGWKDASCPVDKFADAQDFFFFLIKEYLFLYAGTEFGKLLVDGATLKRSLFKLCLFV